MITFFAGSRVLASRRALLTSLRGIRGVLWTASRGGGAEGRRLLFVGCGDMLSGAGRPESPWHQVALLPLPLSAQLKATNMEAIRVTRHELRGWPPYW